MIEAYAQKLIKDVEKILKEIDRKDKLFVHEAINWADLHCVDVADVDSYFNDKYIQVTIEEAAPECLNFQAHIIKKLEEIGYKHVNVVTQW